MHAAIAVFIREAQQPHRAVTLVGPARVVQHRIQTDTFHRHPALHGQACLLADIAQPVAAQVALGAGFGDQQGPFIALPDFTEDALEGPVVRVAALDGRATQVPLVVRVVVDADDIEVLRLAAQPRPGLAAEHVPGFELRLAGVFRLALRAGAVVAGADVDGRIDLDEARPRLDFADRLDGGDAGAYQLVLELGAPAQAQRVEVAVIAAGPGPEGNLVDRRVEGHRVAFLTDQSRGRGGEAGETLDEARSPDVQIVRQAGMAKVADCLGAAGVRRSELRQEAGPVVVAGPALDQVPAQAVAHRADALALQRGVVLGGPAVMPGSGQQIEPATVATAMGRALEAALKEAVEQAGLVHRLPLVDHAGLSRPVRPGKVPARQPRPRARLPRYACTAPAPGPRPGPCCSTCRCRAGRRRSRPASRPPVAGSACTARRSPAAEWGSRGRPRPRDIRR